MLSLAWLLAGVHRISYQSSSTIRTSNDQSRGECWVWRIVDFWSTRRILKIGRITGAWGVCAKSALRKALGMERLGHTPGHYRRRAHVMSRYKLSTILVSLFVLTTACAPAQQTPP